jgi:zinc finger protein
MEKDFHEEYTDCFICGARGTLRIAYRFTNLPVEGKAILLSLKCGFCGYRATDIYPLRENREKLIKIEINSEKDLNKLVYVSSGSRVLIPELKLELELKQIDKGFVTTVEGILERFKEKTEYVCTQENVSSECAELLGSLEKAFRGELKFSLIIEDPFGRSSVF